MCVQHHNRTARLGLSGLWRRRNFYSRPFLGTSEKSTPRNCSKFYWISWPLWSDLFFYHFSLFRSRLVEWNELRLLNLHFSNLLFLLLIDVSAVRIYETCVVWRRLDCQLKVNDAHCTPNARRLSQIKSDNLANNYYFYLYALHIVHNFHCKTIILRAVHSVRCMLMMVLSTCKFSFVRFTRVDVEVRRTDRIPEHGECDGKSA